MAFATVGAVGCAPGEELELGKSQGYAKVSDFISGTCSTSGVVGLSKQIGEEVGCMSPGALESFDEGGGIVFSSSAVIPMLSSKGVADLKEAAASSSTEIRINSGYRTVVQQYLLYRWYQAGRCGITAAATPGRSNHESGRALDIANYSYWSSRLPNFNWKQTVPGDDVHFDHQKSPDIRGYDVLAFQRLWNRNNPNDKIDEDGLYGPQTGARISKSPAEGFPMGGCPAASLGGELVAIDIPDRVEPGEEVSVTVSVRNTGGLTWQPDSTFLGTRDPDDRESPLFVEGSWYAPNRPATVAAVTEPGDTGDFSFKLIAPDALGTYSEKFGLVEETVAWFESPEITIELNVGVDGEGDDDVPGNEDDEDEGDAVGSCSTAPGSPLGLASSLGFLGLALVSLRIRRRGSRR